MVTSQCQKFGDFIRSCRKLMHKSPDQLAQELNVHPGTVSRWERGRSLPTESMCRKIAPRIGAPILHVLSLRVEAAEGNPKAGSPPESPQPEANIRPLVGILARSSATVITINDIAFLLSLPIRHGQLKPRLAAELIRLKL